MKNYRKKEVKKTAVSHMITKNKVMHMLFVVAFIFLFPSCSEKDPGFEAGWRYCNCLKQNQGLGKRLAVQICDSLIKPEYPLYDKYVTSLDKLRSEIYTKAEIDSMFWFIVRFNAALDSCKAPFMFEEYRPDTSIYKKKLNSRDGSITN